MFSTCSMCFFLLLCFILFCKKLIQTYLQLHKCIAVQREYSYTEYFNYKRVLWVPCGMQLFPELKADFLERKIFAFLLIFICGHCFDILLVRSAANNFSNIFYKHSYTNFYFLSFVNYAHNIYTYIYMLNIFISSEISILHLSIINNFRTRSLQLIKLLCN